MGSSLVYSALFIGWRSRQETTSVFDGAACVFCLVHRTPDPPRGEARHRCGKIVEKSGNAMKKRKEKFDIVTFELIKNGLSEIADEMMTTLYRTGRSVNTTQTLDCSA